MPTKRISTGWRGFSKSKETAYGTAQTLGFALNFEGPPTDIEINEALTNEEEITGLNEPDTHDILNWKLEGNHVQRLQPHNAAFFLGLALGKITQDQPDNVNDPTVYRHWIERDLANVAMKSVTMVEDNGVNKKQYVGIFGRSVKITGDRGGFARLEASFGGQGKEETSATGKPSVVAESYLRYGDVNFTRGGSLSGTVAAGTLAVGGGPTSFKADLRSFEYTVDADPQPVYEMGDNTGLVTRVERGDRFQHTLSAVLEMQDDSHKTGLSNGTTYVMNIPITGAVIPGGSGNLNFTVDLIFPKVVYREAKKDIDGRAVIVNADFQVLEDSTYGSVIAKVINEQQSYLI